MKQTINIPIEDLVYYVKETLRLNAIDARAEGSTLTNEEDALLWCEELGLEPTTDYEIIAKARIKDIYGIEVK